MSSEIYVIVSGIIGLLLGSILTSQRELKTYRRNRLEHMALKFSEFYSLIDKHNDEVIVLVSDDGYDEFDLEDYYEYSEQIYQKSMKLRTMYFLHARHMNKEITKYTETLSVYRDHCDDAIQSLPIKISEKDAMLDKVEKHFSTLSDCHARLLIRISDELYDINFGRKLLRYISWPFFLIRKK